MEFKKVEVLQNLINSKLKKKEQKEWDEGKLQNMRAKQNLIPNPCFDLVSPNPYPIENWNPPVCEKTNGFTQTLESPDQNQRDCAIKRFSLSILVKPAFPLTLSSSAIRAHREFCYLSIDQLVEGWVSEWIVLL